MAKGGLARQRYEERKKNNQIVAQLQGLKDQGFTDEQIRNAGNNAYAKLAGQTPTTTTAAPGTLAPGTPGAFDNAIAGITQSLQQNAPPVWMQTAEARERANVAAPATPTTQSNIPWWQRGQPGAPKSPFSSVTGTTGMSASPTSAPMYVPGGLSPSQQQAAKRTAQQASPYVPQWLGGISGSVYVPGGLSQDQRDKATGAIRGSGLTGRSMDAPGTVQSRRPNPLTGIPDFPMLTSMESYPGGGYYNWKKRRRRGGGGGSRFYQPRGEGYGKQPYVPSIGQASWSIG